MPDSSEVDAALVTTLAGDATLAALLPDGVFVDVAKAGATQFVIVSLIAGADTYGFTGGMYEESVYLIKAVDKSASGLNVKTAAARIHTLLQDVALTVTGYTHMLTRRQERIRFTEVDDQDRDTRWQHRGGRYAVWVSP